MRQNKTKKIETEQRRERILQQKLMGMTQVAIAKQEGISEAAISKHLKTIMTKLSAANDEMASSLRTIENARLDRIQQAIWRSAITGKKTAIDQLLKIMERRARMNGIDKPTKVAQTTPDGESLPPIEKMSEQELDARIAELTKKINDE